MREGRDSRAITMATTAASTASSRQDSGRIARPVAEGRVLTFADVETGPGSPLGRLRAKIDR